MHLPLDASTVYRLFVPSSDFCTDLNTFPTDFPLTRMGSFLYQTPML